MYKVQILHLIFKWLEKKEIYPRNIELHDNTLVIILDNSNFSSDSTNLRNKMDKNVISYEHQETKDSNIFILDLSN